MKSKVVAAMALAAAALAGSAHAAYGPEAGQPTSAPGGYSQVVTSRTVGEDGARLRGRSLGVRVQVRVARGSFDAPVQLRVLRPKRRALTVAVRAVGRVLAGVGVAASRPSGRAVNRLPATIRVLLRVADLPPDALVLRYDAKRGRYVKVAFRARRDGTIVVRSRRPVALVVVDPR